MVTGPLRVEGGSWYFRAETDREEGEHRCDRLGNQLFCTCRGFIHWRHCKHIDRRRELERDNQTTTELAIVERPAPTALARQNPAALAVRLSDMRENRNLTQRFFKEVMQEGVDYGTIPGTDKPTLFKAGAESLCELYGYAPTYTTEETKDLTTGFLRVVVTCTLVQRGTGEIVAQGVGECNTREARYFYRWMSEAQLKKIPDLYEVRETLKKEQRSGRGKDGRLWSSTYYRVENDDLFTLWNTVLKMAKKRAHVDATLSATRSSGLFSQGAKALEDWIEAEYEEMTPPPVDDAEPEQVSPTATRGAEGATASPSGPSISTAATPAPAAPDLNFGAPASQETAAAIRDWQETLRDRHGREALADVMRRASDEFAYAGGALANLTETDAQALVGWLREAVSPQPLPGQAGLGV